ncbi:MAG TPA: hypothetical protein PKE64_06585 [Anaerolineae bacterium]|nr:hypothetical protein [Anaerolineae bacterium]HMR63665.1 hypothetical protein [Anaerolineae bacterium]
MSISEARCPECGQRLKQRGGLHPGQRLTCPACEMELVVVGSNPPKLTARSAEDDFNPKRVNDGRTTCPECNIRLKVNANVREGQRLRCTACSSILEVVSLDPLELDLASQVDLKDRGYDHYDQPLGKAGKLKNSERDWL